jgi:hypothetical protein
VEPIREAVAVKHRRRLLLFNQERIEFAYEKAKADGMDDPVIVVLDLHDERAAKLAQLTGLPKEQADRWCQQCSRHDSVPTQILAAPRWATLAVIGPMTPNSPQGILKPSPPDTFRVIAIAADGNAFADFPSSPS